MATGKEAQEEHQDLMGLRIRMSELEHALREAQEENLNLKIRNASATRALEAKRAAREALVKQVRGLSIGIIIHAAATAAGILLAVRTCRALGWI